MTQSPNSQNRNNPAAGRPASTTDAAKQQASNVADTAKDQAGAVKDTAAQQANDVKDTALAGAQDVKDTATQAGRQVAETAKDEVVGVAADARDQIRGLVDQTMGEVRGRASDGQAALASTVSSLTDELSRLTRGESTNGPVAQFADELANRGQSLGSWLESNGPDDVVREVRRYAARRPVAFLALAAGAGMLAGRLARGTREIAKDEKDQRELQQRHQATDTYRPATSYTQNVTHTQPTGYATDVTRQGLGTPATGVDADALGTGLGTTGLGTPGAGFGQPEGGLR